MKKFGLIALMLVTATGAYAQKGVEDGSRYGHGQDSIDTWRNISMYQEYYKTNDFKEAYEQGWQDVFRDAPLASVNTYNYGIKILRNLYNDAKKEKNEELMAKYSDELFQVYEQRLKYLDQLNAIAKNKVTEAEILGQYGHDYTSYNPKVSISRAYEILHKAVELGKGETQYYVLDDLMRVSAQRFANKKDNDEYRDALIQDYLDCAAYIDVFIELQTDDAIIEKAMKVKENIDGRFINSGAADCDRLQAIYGPKIENKKDDFEYLSKVVKVMTVLSPTAQTAKSLGRLYLTQREDTEKALEYFNQAIELDDDSKSKADTYYYLATLYMSKEKYDNSRSNVQKCIANNPNKGEAYILLAQLYALNVNWSNEPALNRCAYFAVIDKLEQAKRMDPSVTERANDLISQYKKQTPQVEDLFMLGIKAGDKVEIKGWINETVTVR